MLFLNKKQKFLSNDTFTLTNKADYADAANSFHNEIADIFKFTNGNDIVEASNITLGSGDTLMDGSTADNDSLNFTLTDSFNVPAGVTISNVETISLDVAAASKTFSLGSGTISGLKNIVASGKGITINASTYDKNGLNISGGAGDDVLIGTKNADVFTGGAGQDKFNISASNVLNLDTIADFDKATDKDKITGVNVTGISKHTTDKTTLTDALSELSVSTGGAKGTATLTLTDATLSSGTTETTFTIKLADSVTGSILPDVTVKFESSDPAVSTTTLGSGDLATKIAEALNGKTTTEGYTITATAGTDTDLGKVFVKTSANTILFNDDVITVTKGTNVSTFTDVTGTGTGGVDGSNAAFASGNTVWFELGNSTYVVVDANNNKVYDAADNVVALTGTNLDLATTDFVTA